MPKWMLTVLILIVVGLAGAAGGLVPSSRAGTSPQNEFAMRVGTFERSEVLVAYYASTIHERAIKKLMEVRDQAKAGGDQKKMAELEATGAALQELAHKQLAGEAMLTNVLEHVQGALPTIAKEAGVALIVEQPLFQDSSVQIVDLSRWLVKQFEPARKKKP